MIQSVVQVVTVQQGGSMKELIGKNIKGFIFEPKKSTIFLSEMNDFIGKIGIIIEADDEDVKVSFDGCIWFYPLPEALNHIVEEHPQRGDEVLVWDEDEIYAVKRIFLAYIEGANYPVQVVYEVDVENFKNGKTFSMSSFKHYKPLPQKTKLTLQQIADKFGVDVNDLEVEI